MRTPFLGPVVSTTDYNLCTCTYMYIRTYILYMYLCDKPVDEVPKHDGVLGLLVIVGDPNVTQLPELLPPASQLVIGRPNVKQHHLRVTHNHAHVLFLIRIHVHSLLKDSSEIRTNLYEDNFLLPASLSQACRPNVKQHHLRIKHMRMCYFLYVFVYTVS